MGAMRTTEEKARAVGKPWVVFVMGVPYGFDTRELAAAFCEKQRSFAMWDCTGKSPHMAMAGAGQL